MNLQAFGTDMADEEESENREERNRITTVSAARWDQITVH